MERKARAENSRKQRAKAPEHPICAPCGNKASAEDELLSTNSSCASVHHAGAPAVIAAPTPAPTHESPRHRVRSRPAPACSRAAATMGEGAAQS